MFVKPGQSRVWPLRRVVSLRLVPADWLLRGPIDYVDGSESYFERALGRTLNRKAQVDERSARQRSIIDRVLSIILLISQPFVAVAQFLIVSLGGSEWMDGSRSIPQWAATIACVLIFFISLAAAIATIVLIAKRRVAFWVPLLAMVLTSMMVGVLDAYGQTRNIS